MTVMVLNLDSNCDGSEQPMKESKRLHTACSTVRDAKRRHIASPSVMAPCEGGDGGSGLSEADEDYLHFLSQLSANDSDVCSLKDDQGGGPAPDDVDPHYMIFLENLKIEGTSYALEVELEGRTVLLKYESEGSPCTVVNPDTLGNGNDDFKKENVQSIGSWKKTRSERDNMVTTLRKRDGKQQSNVRKNTSKEKSHKISRKVEVNQKRVVFRRKNVGVEAKIASARTEICCRNEFDESVHPCNMHNLAVDEEAWDESLLAFVQCLRNDGDVLIYTLDDGKILRYEDDEEEDGVSDVESDVEILDREGFSSIGKNNPFVSARSTDVINVENKECGKVPSRSDSEFRAGLKSELEMPYDDKEYEDLMKMVTHRRCKEVDKELRGGREVSYSLKGVCKSYVDVHKDFARALKLVTGDRKRTLNLLRGFRYWLHNVPKRGSFFPWLDAQCLSLLPGPKSGLLSLS